MFENAVLAAHEVEDVEAALHALIEEARSKLGFEGEVYHDAVEALRTVVKVGYTRKVLERVLKDVPVKEELREQVHPTQMGGPPPDMQMGDLPPIVQHPDRAAVSSHAERARRNIG